MLFLVENIHFAYHYNIWSDIIQNMRQQTQMGSNCIMVILLFFLSSALIICAASARNMI